MSKRVIFSCFILFFLFGIAKSEEKRPVLESSRQIYVIRDGKKIHYEDNLKAKPGEELIFENTYTNTGNDLAKDMKIDIPISEELEYIEQSAECDNCDILFSIDNGDTYSKPPILYNIITKEGNEVEKKAEAAQYTDIRFIPKGHLDSGKSLSFKYRLTISEISKEEK